MTQPDAGKALSELLDLLPEVARPVR
jgi:hypothetical protein